MDEQIQTRVNVQFIAHQMSTMEPLSQKESCNELLWWAPEASLEIV